VNSWYNEAVLLNPGLRFTSTRDSREEAVNLPHVILFTRDSRAVYIRSNQENLEGKSVFYKCTERCLSRASLAASFACGGHIAFGDEAYST